VDRRVGPAFVVGHSFVTPHETIVVGDGGADWFRGVVRTEIQPLLEEYFMDDPANVEKLVNQLLGVDA
jgi:5-methylcytosine-specific restriction protein B